MLYRMSRSANNLQHFEDKVLSSRLSRPLTPLIALYHPGPRGALLAKCHRRSFAMEAGKRVRSFRLIGFTEPWLNFELHTERAKLAPSKNLSSSFSIFLIYDSRRPRLLFGSAQRVESTFDLLLRPRQSRA